MDRRRAQMWIVDSMMAGMFIIVVISSMLATNETLASRYTLADAEFEQNFAALAAADSVVLTGGAPGNWHQIKMRDYAIASFGLASSPNVIDFRKASRMQDLYPSRYDEIRRALGLGKKKLSIEILPLGGGPAYYSFGTKSDSESRSAVFERVASLNGTYVTVRLEVG